MLLAVPCAIEGIGLSGYFPETLGGMLSGSSQALSQLAVQWFLNMTLDFLDISPESEGLCPLSWNLGGFTNVWTSKIQTKGQHGTSKTEWLKHLRLSANRRCSYHCICWNTSPGNPKPPWKKRDSHVVRTPGYMGRPHLGPSWAPGMGLNEAPNDPDPSPNQPWGQLQP